MLSLKTPDDIDRVVNFLHSCHAEVLSAVEGPKVTVALRGIASMQKNVKDTRVIYAVPQEGNGQLRLLSSTISCQDRLMKLDLLQSKFKEAGFLEGDHRSGQEVKVFLSKEKWAESSCIVRY